MTSVDAWGGDRPGRWRGLVAAAVAVALVGGLLAAGTVVAPQSAQPATAAQSAVGRTASICTVADARCRRRRTRRG